MNTSCEWIPHKKGTPSKLFTDLMQITENRERAKELYSLVSLPEVQEALGLNEKDSLGEPVMTEVLEKVGNPRTFLGDSAYRKYVTQKENLGRTYDDFSTAYAKAKTLINTYQDYAFSVLPDGDSFRIAMDDKVIGLKGMRNTVFNGELQNHLLSILRSLGFDVKEGSTVGNSNRFSPLTARKNAEGLQEVISIAKGQKGEEAFPEEFAHVMIEGLQRHPLVRRLLDTLSDKESVQAVLGEDYERYKQLYKGNEELLRKEAAGKILAQSILGESSMPLAGRIYSISLNRLSGLDRRRVAEAIAAAEETADSLVDAFEESDTYAYFSREDVMSGKELSSLSKEVRELQEAAEAAYNTLNRKMRISAARSKVRRPDSRENKALANMREQLQKKDYASSIYTALIYVLDDVQELYNRVKDFNDQYRREGRFKLGRVQQSFKLIRRISDSLAAYSDVIDRLAAIREMPDIQEALSEEDISGIEERAIQITAVCKNLKKLYENSRRNTIFEFFRGWLGDDRITGRDGGVNINEILDQAPHDVTDLSRLFNSMEDSSDSLLAILDNILKKVLHVRDKKIVEVSQTIKAIQDRYYKESSSRDTSFMYERDAEGKLTGMIISDIDYAKYYSERKDYIRMMKDRGMSQAQISANLETWTLNHTKVVKNKLGKKERVPKQELYPSDALNRLTDAQRKYYDSMMEVKQLSDSLLPSKYMRTHRAPMKRASTTDAVMTSSSTKQAVQQLKGAFRNAWVRTTDDADYGTVGESVIDAETGELMDVTRARNVLLDFAGNPVARIPLPYATRLEDMNALSTNFTDSMLAYSAMALNYNEISRVADAMEVIKEFVGDREVRQTVGRNPLVEKSKNAEGETVSTPVVKKGYDSAIYRTFEGYLARNIYGKRKNEDKLYLGNKEVHMGKVLDNFKWYATLLGMGYNIFSFGSNVTMGNAQLLLEALSGRWDKTTFNLKDLAKGMAFYIKHMTGVFADRYRDMKKDKLSLLLRQFDPEEEMYRELSNDNTAQGVVKRSLSLLSPLQGMSAGEHYLHSVVMAAYLNHIKVRVGDKTMSLLDAYETKEAELSEGMTETRLVLPEGTELVDGGEMDEEFLFNTKRRIQVISHRINGAYSDVDKGQINNIVYGRLLMQYRQWMPAFYMNRFKTSRYNAVTDRMEEGYYLTAGKFMLQILKDVGDLKFTFFTRFKQLSSYQKASVMKAIYELSMFGLLSILLNLGGGEPDEEDSYAVNYLRYMAYRLKLELGSGTPTLAVFENTMTLIQSPVPAMEKMNALIDLFTFSDLGRTIETGKYAGWNKYLRNVYFAVPFARNIGRAAELGQGQFDMFRPYLD